LEASTIDIFAQETEELVVRRVAVWDLFYQGMIAAFVVGSLVQGTLVYIYWRFRESNPRNRIRTQGKEV